MKNIIIAFVVIPMAFGFAGCKLAIGKNEYVETETGLKYKILQKGKGKCVMSNDKVAIHETMKYPSGSEYLFDSYQQSDPITVELGKNHIIDGLEEGLLGMREGEIRQLIIPPHLCKRTEYPAIIHPDSTLVYHVEVINVFGTDS